MFILFGVSSFGKLVVKLTEPGATHLASSARLSLEKLVVDEFTLVPLSVTKQLASSWSFNVLSTAQGHCLRDKV